MVGRELRVARIVTGKTQQQIGNALHLSNSQVSRVEHGLIRGLTMAQLHRHAAVVGLKLYLNLYPLIARPLDSAQLQLFERFRARIASGWKVTLEATMPIRGDLRAADAVLSITGCRCVVEIITRLADFQAQLRSARRKVRDLEADRLILAVAATQTNRRAIRDSGRAVDEAFPVRTKGALRALAAGTDPGGDALIVL
jgi:transcriptional regulator with XRE-family HTH domain